MHTHENGNNRGRSTFRQFRMHSIILPYAIGMHVESMEQKESGYESECNQLVEQSEKKRNRERERQEQKNRHCRVEKRHRKQQTLKGMFLNEKSDIWCIYNKKNAHLNKHRNHGNTTEIQMSKIAFFLNLTVMEFINSINNHVYYSFWGCDPNYTLFIILKFNTTDYTY